jgi:hypothetical protein
MSLTKVTLYYLKFNPAVNMTCNHACMEFHHLSGSWESPTLTISKLSIDFLHSWRSEQYIRRPFSPASCLQLKRSNQV